MKGQKYIIQFLIATILLVSFGGYLYIQKRESISPVTPSTLTEDSVSPNKTTPSENRMTMLTYDQLNSDQKSFIDKLEEHNSYFRKDKIILFYYDPGKNIVVVGEKGNDSPSEIYNRNNLFVSFYHPFSIPENLDFEYRFPVSCKNATTLPSSCGYLTDNYLVFFTEDRILTYKAGDYTFNKELLKTSCCGNYVKERDPNGGGDILDTSFDGKTITATLYTDQYLGMGIFDYSKKIEALHTEIFRLD